MDNLELRQRITRSMIRVAERTQNMRRPEKFEYRKHMTNAFMEMLELCIEANARGATDGWSSRTKWTRSWTCCALWWTRQSRRRIA